MNNFIFENKTKIFFGRGCVKEFLQCQLKTYGETIMLVYGGGSIKKNGIYDEVVGILQAANKNIVEFPGIVADLTYAKVQEGASLAKESKAGFILGVGGGSVMDCCKGVALAAATDKDIWTEYYEKQGIINFELLPVGAIVTVTGSGSEMNGIAVITNEEKKKKTGIDYERCNPQFAMLDPAYTFSVPPLKTAAGGISILNRFMESYFGKPDEDNVSDDIAEALMRSVVKNLPAALRNPQDYTARSNLMWAAAMAANRIVRLGKEPDALYRHICTERLDKAVRFAVNVWGVQKEGLTEEETAREGIERLKRFKEECGLK